MFGLFKRKKEDIPEIEASIKFVDDEKGDRYLHIEQFKDFIKKYRSAVSNDPNMVAVLNQIVEVLNSAKNGRQ